MMELSKELRDLKIMLIDDDEWIRDSLRLFFQNEGCALMVFETAEEGLDALKEHGFDIIIVDYKLPGMNGLEFVKTTKTIARDAKTVLITAYWNEDILHRSIEVGIDDFIKKPFTSQNIVESLSSLIDS